jgi:hypothetical protein
MSSKFKYPIDPAKVYTLQYEDFSTEVSGEEILAAFRRGAYLDKILEESDTWQKIFNQNLESQETSSKT